MRRFAGPLLLASFCSLLLVHAQGAPPQNKDVYQALTVAIRANDLSSLRTLLADPAAANVVNSVGSTPLHYAASYGSTEAVRILLAAGANPNLRNSSGATPLLYAAWNFDRTRAMGEKHADVKASNKAGITPLMVACSTHGNIATLRYLIDQGADIRAVDQSKTDALMSCAAQGDVDMVALLVARGADVHSADGAGFTALNQATTLPAKARLEILLKAGSDPNAGNTFGGMVKNGPIALVHLTPLMLTVPYADVEAVNVLLKAGAHVNDSDSRKMTPLMLAIATDQAKPEIVKILIDAGANVNAQDQNNESVLDWARKFNRPEIVASLLAAGAKSNHPPPPVPALSGNAPADGGQALQRASALLAKADSGFFREGGGCAGCHHQSAYARVHAAWTDSGVHSNMALDKPFLESVLAMRPMIANAAPVLGSLPGDVDPGLYILAAYADLHAPASEVTDMWLHFIVSRQEASGGWPSGGIARPPLEDSPITRTVYALRALKQYGWPARKAEFDDRIARAARWLQQAKPATTYEAAERLLGLQLAGVGEPQHDAQQLIAMQRADGGWAQTPYLTSDAYATGMILDILYKTGFAVPSDSRYERGIAYLLKTQYPDGSWYVRSRAPKFQPYFQSGFPHDHDQWISSTATSWALIALSHDKPLRAGL